MIEKVRRHMIFKGRVQGVGFRFVAVNAARNIGLTGWVKNCWDGSVELEAQGSRQQIDLLLEALYSANYIRIEDIEMEKIPLEEERGFLVRY